MLDFILFCCLFHAPSYLYTYVALSHNSWEEPMVSVAQALNIPSLFHQNICFHASLDDQNPRLPSISAVLFSHAIILMLSTRPAEIAISWPTQTHNCLFKNFDIHTSHFLLAYISVLPLAATRKCLSIHFYYLLCFTLIKTLDVIYLSGSLTKPGIKASFQCHILQRSNLSELVKQSLTALCGLWDHPDKL